MTNPPVELIVAAFPGGVGAVAGGLAAKLRDSGFPDSELRALGDNLQPGTSAIVAVIEHTWVTDIQNAVAAEGGKMVRQAIADDIRSQLEASQAVTYSALASEGGIMLNRTSAGEDSIEIDHVTVDEAGITVASVQASAHPAAAPEAEAPAAPAPDAPAPATETPKA